MTAQHPHGFGPAVEPGYIPPELRGGYWCVWKAIPKAGKLGKYDKIPSNGRKNLSPYSLDDWLTFDQALATYDSTPGQFNGIGKLITPADNVTIVDLDGVDPAIQLQWLEGWPTYWERSPSGKGMRGVSLGRTSRDISKPIEVYAGHSPRFLTFTGDVLLSAPVIDLSQQIQAYIDQHAGESVSRSDVGEVPEPIDPDEILLLYPEVKYPAGADRSDHNFKEALRLLRSGASPREIFSLFLASEEVWQMAWEHRPRNSETAQYAAACKYLWSDIKKAEDMALAERDASIAVFEAVPGSEQPTSTGPFEDISGSQPGTNETQAHTSQAAPNPRDWFLDLMPDQHIMDRIGNEVILYENLIIQGHLIVIPAPPNAGKTTIFMWLAGLMSGAGQEVVYVNADVGGVHAKQYQQQAQRDGFRLLLPDYKEGLNMGFVIDRLKWVASQDADLHNQVYIFDTLKKMTDVIDKKAAKELYNTLRALTARGATVILLAHVNKYKLDGEYVYEGTADLEGDVDEMIYFYPHREGRVTTVSTKIKKARGLNHDDRISFQIDGQRNVTQIPYVDLDGLIMAEHNQEEDGPLIEAIKIELEDAIELNHGDLLRRVQQAEAAGKDRINKVLARYEGVFWVMERQRAMNNRKVYRLIEASTPGMPESWEHGDNSGTDETPDFLR